MKSQIKAVFKTPPSFPILVPFLLWFFQRRRDEQHFQIRRPNPHDDEGGYICQARLDISGWGCELFQKSIKDEKASKLRLLHENPNGTVEQDYGSDYGKKVYTTTPSTCNCLMYCNVKLPCRHIVFFRRQYDLPIYDKSLFDEAFHDDFILDNGAVENPCEATDRDPTSLQEYEKSLEHEIEKLTSAFKQPVQNSSPTATRKKRVLSKTARYNESSVLRNLIFQRTTEVVRRGRNVPRYKILNKLTLISSNRISLSSNHSASTNLSQRIEFHNKKKLI